MFDHLRKNEYFPLSRRSAAGSASRSGREGRGFKSRRLDHFNHGKQTKTLSFGLFFIYLFIRLRWGNGQKIIVLE